MEIFLYALSVMYSPGPVNFMGLNAGLTGQLRKTIGFFLGVGCAMLILFIIMGVVGDAVIPEQGLHIISLLGAIYTFYLAFKMFFSKVESTAQSTQALTFMNGFWIQLLNPKGILVILPVTTVMYPAAKITGEMIYLISILISIGAAAAPMLYAFAGQVLGRKIAQPKWFNWLNKIMAVFLIWVAIFMLKDFVVGLHLL
ncbi:LysE family translocator [Acinetobacter marinus]|nr:LysE family transporter [Acinetobacter marinus]